MNIKTAKEAYELSQEQFLFTYDAKLASLINAAKNAIDHAIEKGQHRCYIKGSGFKEIDMSCRTHLVNLGYTVYQSPADFNKIFISWVKNNVEE